MNKPTYYYYGRTPGVQQNDASETFAVLQSLLNTHTTDDVELYCDKEKKLDTGVKKGGKCENAQKAVKNALEEELIAEMYEMIL